MTQKEAIDILENDGFIKITFYTRKTIKEICTEYSCSRITDKFHEKIITKFKGRWKQDSEFGAITKHYFRLQKTTNQS